MPERHGFEALREQKELFQETRISRPGGNRRAEVFFSLDRNFRDREAARNSRSTISKEVV
jgi:hypothetical protein